MGYRDSPLVRPQKSSRWPSWKSAHPAGSCIRPTNADDRVESDPGHVLEVADGGRFSQGRDTGLAMDELGECRAAQVAELIDQKQTLPLPKEPRAADSTPLHQQGSDVRRRHLPGALRGVPADGSAATSGAAAGETLPPTSTPKPHPSLKAFELESELNPAAARSMAGQRQPPDGAIRLST